MEFGYYPHPLDYTAGDITISTLPDLEQKTAGVLNSGRIDRDWYYTQIARHQDLFSGRTSDLPYPSRVFSLPKTHDITHRRSNDPEHFSFRVWVLGFIYGMRFSETEAGFLDSTPIKLHKLHDMTWGRRDEEKAVVLADQY